MRVLRWSHDRLIFRAFRFGIAEGEALNAEFDVSLDLVVLLSLQMNLEVPQKATIWICLFFKQYLSDTFADLASRIEIDGATANGMCNDLDEFKKVATARYGVYRSVFPIEYLLD
ncbi:hypothetical protein LSTR_LSTR017206 [Laodelphax striatellus]|uniref:Uncharacterized protein n=1 Tax=Laodelphax striatellus TaxID=195883 RepID=A0A482XRS8_LAOST|nr:hypothetical protein LSTR_LSTR017206 [Laodelphax striatellus]